MASIKLPAFKSISSENKLVHFSKEDISDIVDIFTKPTDYKIHKSYTKLQFTFQWKKYTQFCSFNLIFIRPIVKVRLCVRCFQISVNFERTEHFKRFHWLYTMWSFSRLIALGIYAREKQRWMRIHFTTHITCTMHIMHMKLLLMGRIQGQTLYFNW